MRGARAWMLSAFLGIAACHTGPAPAAQAGIWQPLATELPTKWLERTLFSAPRSYVLASSETGAAQVHEVAERADAAYFAVLGRHAARGLIVAVSTDDSLLIASPEELIDTAQRWNAEATGREPPRKSHRTSSKRRRDEIPPELAARILAVGIPIDEPVLALPMTLRRHISYVGMLPTTACLETTCAKIFDIAVERKGISWVQRALLKTVADDPSQEMVRMMQDQSLAALLELWVAVEKVSPEQADAIFERASLVRVLADSREQ